MIDKKELEVILNNMGFASLNQLQKSIYESTDANMSILSSTGSGKTFAFMLAVVNYCKNNNKSVVILAPSRELASQIEDVFRRSKCGYNVTCCYGGHSIFVEKRSLEYNPRVIVGTPGRILDHIENNNFNTENVGMLIYDEFDKLFEFGFDEEMSNISKLLPNVTNRVLSSATKSEEFPFYIAKHNFKEVLGNIDNPLTRMKIREVKTESEDKERKLFELLCDIANEPTIVFCNYRGACEDISDYLYENYIDNEFFHGGMEQFDREKALAKFKNKSSNVLVSTDLAARGIDIENIRNVVHYQFPESPESFVHRNGRTARVDKDGNVYIVTTPKNEDISCFIPSEIEIEQYTPTSTTPPQPEYTTIYFGMGKKDKLSRVDIVGFLCQKGDIEKSDIGIIELKDFHTFVAVKSELAKRVVKRVFSEKIKGKRCKIAISK